MTLIFLGFFLVLMFLVAKASLAKPRLLVRLLIHVLGGLVGLWLTDLLLSVIGFEIPINVFTVVMVAFLGLPGVLVLSALQIFGI